MKGEVWYDVSEIKDWTGHFTGIQRVIFNVGKGLSDELVSGLRGVRYCFFNRQLGVYQETSYSFVEHSYTAPAAGGGAIGGQEFALSAEVIKKLKAAIPAPIKSRIKSALKRSGNIAANSMGKQSRLFSVGDTVIIPGAFWTGFLNSLEWEKALGGIRVFGIMHDLVPIVVPHLMDQVTVNTFDAELTKALTIIDKWLVTSKSTKGDLLRIAKRKGFASLRPDDIGMIRLGDDINISGRAYCPFGSNIKPKKYVLVVGTLEARKNHQLIYQTIKLANERGIVLPPVVLVGKRGWLVDDFIYTLENDPAIKDTIIWLDKVDDAGLRWLYRNCRYTIYPSLYEGWGLPVAESLMYGKPCISSFTSSMPEIAGPIIDYFSPYSSDELLKLMQAYNDKKYLSARSNAVASYKPHLWSDTSKEIANHLL